ncbi:MAG: hypothetical protein CMB53_02245 [Euryarchaeota archaeon]|nr:hypothetical protein [Euryarchaeota archaeon]|tara:strand:- start:17023 stop:17781 length:759 start_codon:yes stop_codon:yes gene_type:complete
MRLHQFLSKCGIFKSKADVKDAIWSGRVAVNGKIVKDIAYEFTPSKRVVSFDGKILELPQGERYFLLNKPAGTICSRLNKQEIRLGKNSVFEIFRGTMDSRTFNSLVTVGRLDEETTGFLLVTTDGKIAHRITDPKGGIGKTYRVETQSIIDEEQVRSIREGVRVSVSDGEQSENYTSKKADITLEGENCAILTIEEGRKREVRRIFEMLGNLVLSLHRESTGNMELSDYGLVEGEFCEISLKEISSRIFNE